MPTSIIEAMVELIGITWNHTCGYLPMVATAQRFSELHPDVSITWHRRSLQEFADAPLAGLAARFDLMVIDHPSTGEAVHQDLLLPLDFHLAEEFLIDQAVNSVGQSHASYAYEGNQYALAIDAAAPISGYRPDLLKRAGAEFPATWDELLALARRGMVTVAAAPIDSLMTLFMLVNALGSEPFSRPDEALTQTEGGHALELLRELVQLSAPGSLERDPIRTWQLLAESDTVAYCPFAYGYSNYSRAGYAANPLYAGGLISLYGKVLRSTLGGAGLAISRGCKRRETALAYLEFTASPSIQRTLYFQSGGQPGHRCAWLDPAVNAASGNFFANTLSTLDSAWVRPRFPGFFAFQDVASSLVHQYLVGGGGAESEVVSKMNDVYLRLRGKDL